MNVRDTSLAALPKALEALSKLQQRIVGELMLWPATRKELAERLGKPINCITAPVRALLDSGHIEESGLLKEHADTHSTAHILRIPREDKNDSVS